VTPAPSESVDPPPAPPSRPGLRLLLFALSGVAAAYVGFVLFPVPTALKVLRHSGYFVMLFSFFGWLLLVRAGWRRWRAEGGRLPSGKLAAGIAIGACTLMALAHETFRSKILFDEYVLQSTAYNLHYFRDNSAIVRAYEVQGVFLPLDTYVDKRPLLFPFLLALTHDLTGYRVANVFWLNTGLLGLTLVLFYAIAWRLHGVRGGLLAVGLLGTLPLFAQNASGAGMELVNLAMLLAVMLHAAAWLRAPDETRLAAFVLAAVLLVQARYESAVFAAAAALAIVLGWWRVRRVILPWPVLVAPWLLVPVALQQKIVAATPVMWELRENRTSRFSVDYLGENLLAARDFLAGTVLTQGNSLLLTALAVPALAFVAIRLWQRRRRLLDGAPWRTTLLLFGGGILAITTLMMFYYWAAFTDPMAARFALPLHLLLALAIVVAARWADRWVPASLLALVLTGIFAVGSAAPKESYHFYSHVGNDELAWEHRVVASYPRVPRLILTNKSPLPWLIESTPAILIGRAASVADRLAEQLHQPDFAEILVTQSARPSTANGDYQLVPEDALPPWIHLELLAERRVGTKLARISRVVGIDLPKDYLGSVPEPVAAEAARPSRPGE